MALPKHLPARPSGPQASRVFSALYLYCGIYDADMLDLVGTLRLHGFSVETVDTRREGQSHDLLNDAVWEHWRDRIDNQEFDIVIASPPPLPAEASTGSGAAGVPTAQQREKIRVASILADRAFQAFAIQQCASRFALLIQPERNQGMVSHLNGIAATAIVARGGVTITTGDLCVLGSCTVKSTELWSVGLDLSAFQGIRCSHQYFAVTSGERAGQWDHATDGAADATTASARYPHDFCILVARACDSACRTFHDVWDPE
jgi:hypothetical protein